jgi:hypothetical protein
MLGIEHWRCLCGWWNTDLGKKCLACGRPR